MLIHIVCWKYRSDVGDDVSRSHRARLQALTDVIPEIVTLMVGADILHLERSFDSGLVVHFRDREGLDRYTDHPEHQKVAAMGKEISEKVVSVDFFI
jgi:hypothetical protein